MGRARRTCARASRSGGGADDARLTAVHDILAGVGLRLRRHRGQAAGASSKAGLTDCRLLTGTRVTAAPPRLLSRAHDARSAVGIAGPRPSRVRHGTDDHPACELRAAHEKRYVWHGTCRPCSSFGTLALGLARSVIHPSGSASCTTTSLHRCQRLRVTLNTVLLLATATRIRLYLHRMTCRRLL